VIESYKEEKDTLYIEVQQFVDNPSFQIAVYLNTGLGCTLALNYFLHFLVGCGRAFNWIEKDQKGDGGRGIIGLLFVTSDVIGAARSKKAATRKVNLMLDNASSMHTTPDTVNEDGEDKSADDDITDMKRCRPGRTISLHKAKSDAVFQNFTLRGERYETAGSLIWAWKHLLNRDLFDVEGIWLPSRLSVFQFGMAIIGVAFSFALFRIIEPLADLADQATLELERSVSRFENIPRFERYPQWVYDLVPNGEVGQRSWGQHACSCGLFDPTWSLLNCVELLVVLNSSKLVILKTFRRCGWP